MYFTPRALVFAPGSALLSSFRYELSYATQTEQTLRYWCLRTAQCLLLCLLPTVANSGTLPDLAPITDVFPVNAWEIRPATDHPDPFAARPVFGFLPGSGTDIPLEAGSAYWVRFPLRNESSSTQRFFLRLSASDFLETRLYLLPTGNGIYTDGSLPPPVADQGRQVSIFPLDLGPGEEKMVLLYLDRRYLPISTKMTLYTDTGLLAREQRASFGGGIYSGAALLYLLIALFLLALFRNRESLYYLLYIFGSAFYVFYSRFIPLKEWLHAASVGYLFDALPYISIACSMLGQLGLFALIFRLSRWKRLNGLADSLKVVCALLVVVLLFWPFLVSIDSRLYLWVVYVLAGCSLSIVLFMVVGGPLLFWRRRRPEEAIFLLGFAPFVLVVVVIWFMEGGWLPRSAVFYDNAPGIIIFYESLVLGVLLIYQEIRERIRLRLALDNERLELVQDLHSGLLPELDALAEINRREVRPGLPAAARRIEELGEELSEDLRALMWTLTRTDGGTLDELVARLRQKVHSRFAGSGTVCHFVTEPQILPEDLPVSFTASYHLFHFVKEVANNAAKHAGADHFTCHLTYVAGGLTVSLKDDGRGFTETAAEENSGYGLRELRGRAEKMGGVLEISSMVGRGTEVELVLRVG